MDFNIRLIAGSLLLAVAGSSAAGAQSLPGWLNALGSQASSASPVASAPPRSALAPSRRTISNQRGVVEGPHGAPARRKRQGIRSQDND
jgi:hypothetical protein